MIQHGAYVQDIDGLRLMYQSFGSIRARRPTMSDQWYAVMAGGPLDQIRELQVEMHQYLRLPDPLPAEPLPCGAEPAPRVATADDFRTALEMLCHVYHGLGELRLHFAAFRPGLYAALAAQVVPHLYAAQAALRAYLGWEDVERTLEEMERRFGGEPVNDAPQGAELTPAAEPRP
jgi:hypothetical protein